MDEIGARGSPRAPTLADFKIKMVSRRPSIGPSSRKTSPLAAPNTTPEGPKIAIQAKSGKCENVKKLFVFIAF